MTRKKFIGILAGMGPKSTAPFVDLVVDECQRQYGAKSDMDFPHMMIYSLPTPFYMDKPIDHEEMKTTVCDGLKKLESTGVDLIAMPCNTVHAYYDFLKRCIKIPLLNIVEETLKYVKERNKKIALLATNSTIQSNVYQNGIKSLGHEYIRKSEWQQMTNSLIKGIKANEDKNKLYSTWTVIIDSIKQAGAEVVIIGCTDLNVIAKEVSGIKLIDSARSLASAVVREYLK